jgi:hypothetical protein
MFGYDTFDLTADDFDRLPKGEPMDIQSAPMAEFVRQIRQYYGHL